jgi:hypothetical protein
LGARAAARRFAACRGLEPALLTQAVTGRISDHQWRVEVAVTGWADVDDSSANSRAANALGRTGHTYGTAEDLRAFQEILPLPPST